MTQPYLIQLPAQVTSSPSSPSEIQEVEWVTATDPSSGALYYWNKVTNETTWEIPPKNIALQSSCVYPSTKPESPMLLSKRSKADTLKKTHGASGLPTAVSMRPPSSVTIAGKH